MRKQTLFLHKYDFHWALRGKHHLGEKGFLILERKIWLIVMLWCSYSTIAWTASVKKGVQPNVEYGYIAKTTAGTIFNFFSALGDIAFAYAGHNVVLEIQATIPSTPEKPSKGPMWKGVVVAYIVVAICYFPVALIGYWMFGNAVSDNILITLEKPNWLIAMANIFVVVHVIGSYQVQIQTFPITLLLFFFFHVFFSISTFCYFCFCRFMQCQCLIW